jgi:hypothetical protein
LIWYEAGKVKLLDALVPTKRLDVTSSAMENSATSDAHAN